MASIGRLPERTDLQLYAGDSEIFGLALTDESGPVNTLEGRWAAEIRPQRRLEELVGSFQITFDLDVFGRLEIAVDAGTSQRLGEYRQPLRWDIQQTTDTEEVITHARGLVLMIPDVTRVDL
jgi:hypothetical protein